MDARLQTRIQRYGWDRASEAYEPLWKAQLAGVQRALVDGAGLRPGERVLDVACGTGLVSFAAAQAVGPYGHVHGIDISGRMVDAAAQRGRDLQLVQTSFTRMDAEWLALPDASFDAALCALGLMYLPRPEAAVREMRRVVRPLGRVLLAVWGERARCGWAPLFPIVDAEVASDVCPLFFGLGAGDALSRLCVEAGLQVSSVQRLDIPLVYDSTEDTCDSALVGGPVAMAWSRFDEATRIRVRDRYLGAIEPYRVGAGYRIPAEFVVVAATVAG